jgi:pilus assembly protein CpaF
MKKPPDKRRESPAAQPGKLSVMQPHNQLDMDMLIEDIRLRLIKSHGALFLENITGHMERIKSAIKEYMTEMAIEAGGDREEEIISHLVGLGPVDKLRKIPGISEIMINDPNDVWVEINGRLEKTQVSFPSEKEVRDLLDRMAQRCGRKINMSNPILDARYENLRVNGLVPPASRNTVITIRVKVDEGLLTARELLKNGTFTPEVETLLQYAVKARLNIIVCGPAGSGKTVLLRILGGYIPHDERIITIEDVFELGLENIHPHVVPLEGNTKSEAANIYTLTINSLRMRPERVIIGEIRGPEAIELLKAMGTGHDGSLTSVHTNYARQEVVNRLLGAMSEGSAIPADDLKRMIAETVDLTVFIKKYKDGTRRLHISEITSRNDDRLPDFNDIYRYDFERGSYVFDSPLTPGLLWKMRDNLMGEKLPDIPPFGGGGR